MSDQKPFIEVYWESEIGRQVRIGNWMYVLLVETGEHAWEWIGLEKMPVQKVSVLEEKFEHRGF